MARSGVVHDKGNGVVSTLQLVAPSSAWIKRAVEKYRPASFVSG